MTSRENSTSALTIRMNRADYTALDAVVAGLRSRGSATTTRSDAIRFALEFTAEVLADFDKAATEDDAGAWSVMSDHAAAIGAEAR